MASLSNLDEFDRLLIPDSGEGRTAAVRPEVVVIDDDPDVLAGLLLALQSTYNVETFSSAAKGIAAVSAVTGVVILDVKMPEMDGFAAYEIIRKKDPDLPIIFHSGYQDLKNPYEIINRFRPFGYICKGTELRDLLTQVSRAVYQRQRLAKRREVMDDMSRVRASMEQVVKRARK